MSSSVLFFQTFSEMFPVAAHWIHGSCLEAGNTCQHVWRTPLEALSAPTLAWPLRRPVNTSGPSRQVRHAAGGTAGSSLTSRSEALQQHFYWRDNYKKVQTEQIQTYWNMWGNNWLHCCWLVEASDWQMVLPITNHLYYLILRLLVDDLSINRVIKYWCDLWTRLNDQLLLFLNRFLHLKVPDIYFAKTWLKKKICISDFTSSSCLNWRVEVTNYSNYCK